MPQKFLINDKIKYKPRRIILFGSYAVGKQGPDSDVDLLVIFPGRKKDAKTAVDIRLKLYQGFPLDLLVRTPLAVRRRIAMGDCFMKRLTLEWISKAEGDYAVVEREWRSD